MNILFLFDKPIVSHHGGVQRVTYKIAQELEKKGHTVFYLSDSKNKIDNTMHSQLYIDFDLDTDSLKKTLLELVEAYDIEICINQLFSHNAFNMLKILPNHIKKISAHHSQPFSFYLKEKNIICSVRAKTLRSFFLKYTFRLFPILLRYIYKKREIALFLDAAKASDKIVLLSSRFYQRIRHIGHLDLPGKLEAIPNPNSFEADEIKVRPKENVIVFVARIENLSKNVPAFLHMWKAFNELHPDWNAFIIGTGIDLNYNKELAKMLQCRNLTFVGEVEDVSEYYSKAKFIAVTSFYEGWSLVLTEAMLHGCIPCAFETYESLNDIIDDNLNGITVPPFNTSLMASRISEIIKSNRVLEMSQKAVIKSAQFSSVEIIQKWENLLLDIRK